MTNERPQRHGSAGRANSNRGNGSRGNNGRGGQRASKSGQSRVPRAGEELDGAPRTAGPKVPDEISWQDLDPSARRELRSLPKELAERVGAHLAAAGVAIDDDPELAHKHAMEARRLASRVAVTREALGLTAYELGQYEQALAELRAFRRLSGDDRHMPLVADCERGLGRPERVLELARSPEVERLDEQSKRELKIVLAGARQDMGQPEASVVLLEEDPGLTSAAVNPSLVRLRYAYADALLAVGRDDEGRQWMARVVAEDTEGLTDARERVVL